MNVFLFLITFLMSSFCEGSRYSAPLSLEGEWREVYGEGFSKITLNHPVTPSFEESLISLVEEMIDDYGPTETHELTENKVIFRWAEDKGAKIEIVATLSESIEIVYTCRLFKSPASSTAF